MTDPFENYHRTIIDPVDRAFAITPSDSAELSIATRGLYIGGAGDVVAVLSSGDEVTFTGMLAGAIYPLRVKQVKSTNTTATSIIGLY